VNHNQIDPQPSGQTAAIIHEDLSFIASEMQQHVSERKHGFHSARLLAPLSLPSHTIHINHPRRKRAEDMYLQHRRPHLALIRVESLPVSPLADRVVRTAYAIGALVRLPHKQPLFEAPDDSVSGISITCM
jgi:hypothetical protein